MKKTTIAKDVRKTLDKVEKELQKMEKKYGLVVESVETVKVDDTHFKLHFHFKDTKGILSDE